MLLVVGSGCERGCLSRWLENHGAGGRELPRTERERDVPARDLNLAGIDCSDGLLRCVDGQVEASRRAHLPYPCTVVDGLKRNACVCPWDPVVRCTTGCTDDGLEVIAPVSDAGAEQLCRPTSSVARPLLPGDPIPDEICGSDGIVCVGSIVRVCDGVGRPVRPVAFCLHGCQPAIAIDHGEPMNLDGAVSILCRHDHAERR